MRHGLLSALLTIQSVRDSIEDSGVVTRCSLMTYEADELAQMDFPVERQLVHLIMKVNNKSLSFF